MLRTTRTLSFIIATLCLPAIGAPIRAQQAGQSAPPPAAQAPVEGTLPGGATQLQETHGDWRVVCAQPNGQKICTLSQQQLDGSSRQLVIGLELRPLEPGKAEGTMVLPFGLSVAKPVTLQIGESGPSQSLAFRTCLPVGCVVPITLDASTLASMRNGTTMTVKATGTAGEGDQEVALKISLKGFSGAFDRTAALVK